MSRKVTLTPTAVFGTKISGICAASTIGSIAFGEGGDTPSYWLKQTWRFAAPPPSHVATLLRRGTIVPSTCVTVPHACAATIITTTPTVTRT